MPLPTPSLSQTYSQLYSGRKWPTIVITYSFPTSPSQFSSSGDEAPGFAPLLTSAQEATRLALSLWDDLIVPDFRQISPSSGTVKSDLEFGLSLTGIDYAHAYFPYSGSVWFNAKFGDTSGTNNLINPSIGQHGFATYVHEIGHALGLEHSGDYNGSGIWKPLNFHDSAVLTIMSYFGPNWRKGEGDVQWADWVGSDNVLYSPQTPMLNDVYVIQRMYGASKTTRLGDTTYGFNSNITGNPALIFDFSRNKNPILTIFDSGGTDTLDLSGWSTASFIDLRQGGFTSCNSMTNNIAIAFGCDVENAIGGSGADKIFGNTLNNILKGGAGNDWFDGQGGSDQIYGGSGTDTVYFNLSSSSYQITAYQSYIAVTNAGVTTVIYEAEYIEFSDKRILISSLNPAADTAAPTVISFRPADGAADVPVGDNITLTFSENIVRGTGTITLRSGSATGTIIESFDAATSTRITLSGAALTIDPTSNLPAGTQVFVTLSEGSIKDLAGNSYLGTSVYDFKTAGTLTADDYPNSTGTSGIVLVDGKASDGVLEAAGDIDTFKVTLVSGTTYVFSLTTAAGSLDPYLALYDPDLKLVAYNNDYGSSRNSQVTFTAATGGTYYLQVQDYSGQGTGSYKLQAIKPDTSAPTVVSFLPEDGSTSVSVTSNILVSFSEDITLGTGTITLRSGSATGAIIESYDVATSSRLTIIGPRLTIDPTADLPVGTQVFVTFSAGSIKDLAGNSYSGTSSYDFKTAAASAIDDYPNSTDTPGVVNIDGSPAKGAIESAGDFDLFRVTLVAGTTYTFSLTNKSGSLDPYLALYDASRVLVASNDDANGSLNSVIVFTAQYSGSYFLQTSDYDQTATGTYELRGQTSASVVDDYPNSTETPGVVSIGGSPVNATFETTEDADVFKVTLVAGNTYAFSMRVTSGSLDPYLELFGPKLDLVSENDDYDDNSLNSKIIFTPTESGVYYLRATDYEGSTGSYSLSAEILIDDYPDAASTQGVVTVNGSAAEGKIDFAGDRDVFKVTLVAGTTYKFSLTNTSGSLDPYLALYDADTNPVAYNDDENAATLNSVLNFTAQYSGVYYLQASDYDDEATGSYKLTATVVAANRSPTFSTSSQAVSTNEDTSRSVTLAATDADGDLITYTVSSNPTKGTVTVSGATATYTPNKNYSGTDSFIVRANDGKGGTATQTVNVTVTAVNDAPSFSASSQSVSATAGTAKTITLAATDVDGDALTYTVATPSKGSATISGSTLTYTPTSSASGTDSFVVTARDPSGATATQTINVTISSGSIETEPNNSASNSNDILFGKALTGQLSTSADVDYYKFTTSGAAVVNLAIDVPTNSTLSYYQVSVYNSNNTLMNRFYTGTDKTYQISAPSAGTYFVSVSSDGFYSSDNYSVTLTQTTTTQSYEEEPNNTTANADLLTAGKALTGQLSTSADVDYYKFTTSGAAIVNLAIDVPTNSTLSYYQVSVYNSNNTLMNRFYTGTDKTYQISAPSAGTYFVSVSSDGFYSSDNYSVTLTQTTTNNVPAFATSSQSTSTAEDATKTITVSATDADGDRLTYSVSRTPTNGTTTISGSTVTYTPKANYNGSDSFVVTASDGKGGTATQTVNVTVTAVNDAPSFSASSQSVSATAGMAKTITLAATDVDGDALTYSVATPSKGSATISGSTLTYTPTSSASGADSFVVTARDPSGATATQTINVTVTTSSTTAASTTDFRVTASDGWTGAIGGNGLIYGTSGYQDIKVLSGTVTFDASFNKGGDILRFDAAASSYTVARAGSSAQISAGSNLSAVIPVGTAGMVTSFSDGVRKLVFANSNFALGGQAFSTSAATISAAADGTSLPTGALSDAGARITLAGNDLRSGQTSHIVIGGRGTIYGNSSKSDVVAIASGVTVNLNFDASFNRGGDTIILDKSAGNYSAIRSGASIILTSTNQTLTIPVGTTSTTIKFADDSRALVYSTSEGAIKLGTQVIATTATAITGLNRNPAFATSSQSTSTAEDAAKTITVSATDADGDSITYTVSRTPTNGTTSISGSTVTYTPKANYNGSDSFVVTASDGKGGTTTQTVNVTVTAVNDAPAFSASSQSVSATAGTAKTITLAATDVDGDALNYTTATPSKGSATISGSTLTYTPTSSASGIDSFVVTARDPSGATATQTVNVTVAAVVSSSVSLDVGTANSTASVSGAGGAITFTDDATKNSYVKITGFGSDDVIRITGATQNDYSFSSSDLDGDGSADDLSISYSNAGIGIVNDIQILNVVSPTSFVFDKATAVSAVGFNFVSFG